jgi:hypothetical protein
MSIEGLEPLAIEDFKGVLTLPDAQDVPLGHATDSKNVEYRLGSSVSTRAGRSVFLTLDGAPSIVSMAEYALLDGVQRRLLIMASNGIFWKENGDLSLTQIASGLAGSTRVAMVNAFGREYLAFSDGKLGNAPPRYYDDTALLPVSQSGPGGPPDVVNGAIGGNVTAGLHFMRVIFELSNGYRTAPSPAASVTATGNHKLNVSRIPKGPSNVVRRILIFSAAISADLAPTILPDGVRYFFIPDNLGMVINDNTTVALTGLDFTDAALTAAEDVTDSLFQIVLPEQGGVFAYNDRVGWFAGQTNAYRIADTGLLNMDFDGGFQSPTVFGNVPLGWQGFFNGCDVVSGVPGATGAVFRIVGDGFSQRGTIGNMVQGAQLNTVILPNVPYGGRLRLRRSAGLTQGTVSLYFLSGGSSVVGGAAGLTVGVNQLTTDFQDFTGLIYPATPTTPIDLILKISGGKGGDGFTEVLAPAGEYIDVDFSGIYRMDQPNTGSRIYMSKAGLPGNYTEEELIRVAEDNGQAIRFCWPMRGQVYVFKEQSLWVASDNGDVASNWPVQTVSPSIGTPSFNGVDGGEGWVVAASRAGLYFFDGGFPQKISEEIQPTWDRINWDKGHLIVVKVDTEQKRIFIQVPFDGSPDINRTLYCDWTGSAPVQTRNWCPNWTTPTASMALSRRSNGTLAILFGTLDGSGDIMRLDSSLPYDEPVDPEAPNYRGAIDSFYRTAYGGGPSGVNTVQYLTASAFGRGTLRTRAIGPDEVTSYALKNRVLAQRPNYDLEWSGLRIKGERIAYEFGTSDFGDWFKMRKFCPWGRSAPWGRTRGNQVTP